MPQFCSNRLSSSTSMWTCMGVQHFWPFLCNAVLSWTCLLLWHESYWQREIAKDEFTSCVECLHKNLYMYTLKYCLPVHQCELVWGSNISGHFFVMLCFLELVYYCGKNPIGSEKLPRMSSLRVLSVCTKTFQTNCRHSCLNATHFFCGDKDFTVCVTTLAHFSGWTWSFLFTCIAHTLIELSECSDMELISGLIDSC